MVTLNEATAVPRERWSTVLIEEVYVTHKEQWGLSPDEHVLKALELMVREDKGRIAVVKGGRMIGLVSRNGIARYMQIKGGRTLTA